MIQRVFRRLAFASAVVLAAPAMAQLRIVTLDASNSDPASAGPRDPWMSTILSAIGSNVSDDSYLVGNTGIIKPIDVLCLQEVNSAATTSAQYAALLNTLYPGSNYQYSAVNGNSTALGTQGLIYNANAVTLVNTSAVGTASATGQPRQALRYQLQPVGYDSSAQFYVYNSNYKDANDSSSINRRNVEAQATRVNADALGANQNIIYLGNFNVYTSTESMFATLTKSGPGEAKDPTNRLGPWDGSTTYKKSHTQSPYNAATALAVGSGFTGTGGGMDDRFDFQLVSGAMNDGHGLAYISNSYQAFGNNGTQGLKSPINGVGNTAQPQNVLDAMAAVLDHLPVVADYQLPAKLAVSVGAVPAMVIRNGSASVDVSVFNAAPVSYAVGADVLNYTVEGTGAVIGGVSSSALALDGGHTHPIAISTAAPGPNTGTITVTSTSQQVADNNFSQDIAYTVLDHADPSFAAGADQTTATIDFGYVPAGSAARSIPLSIFNRETTPGYTAKLDVTSVTSTGDASTISTSAGTLSNLAAGQSSAIAAQLDASTAGVFSTTTTLTTSDETLPGAASGANLIINSSARVFSAANFPASGFLYLPASEPLAVGAFSIQDNVTLTKTGLGAMTVNGTQSHGAGSQLLLSGGNITMNTDAGPSAANLSIALQAGASATFNATQHLASLAIADGSATLAHDGGHAIITGGLNITGTGQLDLKNNSLIVHGAAIGTFDTSTHTYNGVTGLIQTGRNAGNWTGPGIITSELATQSPALLTTLAIATADQIGRAGNTWNGQSISSGDVLVMYTYNGDANLDGRINGDDYFAIDSHVNQNGSVFGWVNGDFNFDGHINGDDYFLIDSTINKQGAPLGGFADAAGVVALPEPGMLACLAFALLAFCRRRDFDLSARE